MNFQLLEYDFIAINFLNNATLLKQAENMQEYLVFTSANAVRGLLALGGSSIAVGKKIYCLSQETRTAASELTGIEIVAEADNAANLAKMIVAAGLSSKISFVCGSNRRDELPSILSENGIEVEEVIVYDTVYTSRLVKENYDGIFFFSPSAVESFFQLNTLHNDIPAFCIGNTTAATFTAHSSNPVIVAAQPKSEAVLEAATNYFKKKNTII